MLDDGTLRRYISELSVTGLTSNPTIFDHAISNGAFYDEAIGSKAAEGKSEEALFFEPAIENLQRAADLLRPDRRLRLAVRQPLGWPCTTVFLRRCVTASTSRSRASRTVSTAMRWVNPGWPIPGPPRYVGGSWHRSANSSR